MIIIDDLESFSGLSESVISVGNFDGVHLGHRALISELKLLSKEQNIPSVVVTFKEHPRQILFPESGVKLINTTSEKTELIESLGVDYFIRLSFSEVREISAGDFLQTVLLSKIGMKNIIVGDDFNFGKGRQGNIEYLESVKDQYGFTVTEFLSIKKPSNSIWNTPSANADTPFAKRGILVNSSQLYINQGLEKISSSQIRSNILSGEITQANEKLGYNYFLSGKVVSFNQNILSLEVNASKLIPKLNELYEVKIDDSNNETPATAQIKNVVQTNGKSVVDIEFTYSPRGLGESVTVYFVREQTSVNPFL